MQIKKDGILFSIVKRLFPKPIKVVIAELERALKKDADGIVRFTIDECGLVGVLAAKEFCKWRGWPTEYIVPQEDE